ncbi:unnamed protein product [Trichobilharzia szidati]|nr:unnamed protein product [Trichobilharzia szidati]
MSTGQLFRPSQGLRNSAQSPGFGPGGYKASSSNTNDDKNTNGHLTNNNLNISPDFINKRSHINCNATDSDEPESKVIKSESEWNPRFKGDKENTNVSSICMC